MDQNSQIRMCKNKSSKKDANSNTARLTSLWLENLQLANNAGQAPKKCEKSIII